MSLCGPMPMIESTDVEDLSQCDVRRMRVAGVSSEGSS
jgi:hypothetical protein